MAPVQCCGVAPPQVAAGNNDRQHHHQQRREAPRNVPHHHGDAPEQQHEHQLRKVTEGFGNTDQRQYRHQNTDDYVQHALAATLQSIPPLFALQQLRTLLRTLRQMCEQVSQVPPCVSACTRTIEQPARRRGTNAWRRGAYQHQPNALQCIAQGVAQAGWLVGQLRVPVLLPVQILAPGWRFQAQQRPGQQAHHTEQQPGQRVAVVLATQSSVREPTGDHSSPRLWARHQVARLMTSWATRLLSAYLPTGALHASASRMASSSCTVTGNRRAP
ncbi:hypothetical protein D3C76_559860 [compost metagenome]